MLNRYNFMNTVRLSFFLLGMIFFTAGVRADVTLVENTDYWLLSGTGTYADAISIGTSTLRVDATKRVTGNSASITLNKNVAAGIYDQQDFNFSGYDGGQGGNVYFNGGMTASFSEMKIAGHTHIHIGNGASSAAAVSVAGSILLGTSMTSTITVDAGSTLTSAGFRINPTGAQGVLHINGTVNVTSSEENMVFFGKVNNQKYTSTVNVNNGGVLNILNTLTHCGYDGQLFFNLNAGGTANLYGMTYARNGDQNNAADGKVEKTLKLNGGTLNLGVGGVSIRSGKDAYPFQFISGTIGTIDGCDTTISNVQLAIGSGVTAFKPAAGATITVSSAFADSTWAAAGTGGVVEMSGAGTLNVAGTFNTTGGLNAKSGTTLISGTFAGGPLTVNGGTVNVTGNATGGTLTVNSGTLKLTYTGDANKTSVAPVTVNAGGTLTLSTPVAATGNAMIYNPVTLNGGTLLSDNVSSKWKRLMGKLTLTADSVIQCDSRFELYGNLEGSGLTLTKNGGAELIFHTVGLTGLKKIICNNGTFVVENASANALVTTDGVYMNGGTLQDWGVNDVHGKIFMNGGRFQSHSGGNTSFAADSSITFLKNTDFETTTYENNTPNFTMKGTLTAADGIIVSKVGARNLILAGNLDGFDGTFKVNSGEVQLQNGGNTAASAYDFDVNLAGGAFRITDGKDYYFKDSTIAFSNAAKTFDVGDARLHTLTGTTLKSTVSGAVLSGTGSLDLGAEGNATAFNVADGASLSVTSAVTTQGGAFTKTGNGTLSIGTLTVNGGSFNLSTSAVESVGKITVTPGAKITADSPVSLNSELTMGGTFVVDVTGTAKDWNVSTLDLTSTKSLSLTADTVFELASGSITEPLDWSSLLSGEKEYLLLDSNGNFAGQSFSVALSDALSMQGLRLFAVGDVNGDIYLRGQLPEPASWLLFIAGAAGLFWCRRRTSVSGCVR